MRLSRNLLSSVLLVYNSFTLTLLTTYNANVVEQVINLSGPVSDISSYAQNNNIANRTSKPLLNINKSDNVATLSLLDKMQNLATCIQNECNNDKVGVNLPSGVLPLLPFQQQHDTTNSITASVSIETHICPEKRIGYIHVFKSAGTFSLQIFHEYCRQSTGNNAIICAPYYPESRGVCDEHMKSILSKDGRNSNQKKDWTLWTVLRNPTDRFISGMFEHVRREVELNVSATMKYTSIIEKNSNTTTRTNNLDDVTMKFIDLNLPVTEINNRIENEGGYYDYDMHLHPQIDFIVNGATGRILSSLNYVVSMERGRDAVNLADKLHTLMKHLFSYSQPMSRKFETRNHSSSAYANININNDMEIFQNMKFEHLSMNTRERIRNLHRRDEKCFNSCEL